MWKFLHLKSHFTNEVYILGHISSLIDRIRPVHASYHGLRTPNEGINQRDLKNWANEADKICFGRT